MSKPIVVIDDQVEDAESVYRFISASRLVNEIVVFVDYNDAFAYVKSGNTKPDLIVLSLSKDGYSGRTFLKKIKALECCKYIPIMVIVSPTDKEDVWNDMYFWGARGVLVKPLKHGTWEQSLINAGIKFEMV